MDLRNLFRFCRRGIVQEDERGATMVEYVLIASSIAVVVIASAFFVGERSSDTFVVVADELAGTNFEPPDERPRRP